MSRENVELVAAALDAFEGRDKAGFVELVDPKMEWELVGLLPDQERLRIGPDQIWEYMTFLDQEFVDIRVERDEYLETDRGQVLVPVRWRGRGRASGVEVDLSFTSVFTVSDGRLLRARNYPTTKAALEAVGLRE